MTLLVVLVVAGADIHIDVMIAPPGAVAVMYSHPGLSQGASSVVRAAPPVPRAALRPCSESTGTPVLPRSPGPASKGIAARILPRSEVPYTCNAPLGAPRHPQGQGRARAAPPSPLRAHFVTLVVTPSENEATGTLINCFLTT